MTNVAEWRIDAPLLRSAYRSTFAGSDSWPTCSALLIAQLSFQTAA
jgi:hypothetical protein